MLNRIACGREVVPGVVEAQESDRLCKLNMHKSIGLDRVYLRVVLELAGVTNGLPMSSL